MDNQFKLEDSITFYKKAVIRTVSVIVTLLAGISVATTVQAKSYSWSSTSDGQRVETYYTKPTQKNAYIWNTTHTKHTHNLKNYGSTIWRVNRATTHTS
ncbi:hypothetical protein AYR62_14185 [Secundilactobacillus paracollinoides]|uniref:Uncharacterized protein n=1 Tax=Secundilactobacillus paracollinoides TaxID=240427 RepID=A0A1B2IX20_9LACO|nr:hypothetical protein AYR61_04890 [Secundilactobacillus paracollinoides]ANZ65115.1 hypothetical protein AYR62_14185 [Secundilactobacillus paracollinoides]ANZ66587.1 hypothetical protein AYR63_05180 [Secundilactobacillus paracollinoides]